MAKATIKKILSCTVDESRETENGVTHRVTFAKNEIAEGGVKMTLKVEYIDAIPSKWLNFLDGIDVTDTMIIEVTTGTRQEKL